MLLALFKEITTFSVNDTLFGGSLPSELHPKSQHEVKTHPVYFANTPSWYYCAQFISTRQSEEKYTLYIFREVAYVQHFFD